jgi:hypothetical protein
MANNRMFLVYRPTGDVVYLGKRMGYGWYGTPEDVAQRIAALFEKAENAAGGDISQDDFAIALEFGDNQPHAISDWKYGERASDGSVSSIAIEHSVPYGKPECV